MSAPLFRSLLTSLLAGSILTVSAQAADIEPTNEGPLAIKALDATPVTFHGMANFDHAGMGSGAMMYPAAGAIGFAAAILTHGLISSSSQKKQKDQIQADADKVLEPYKTVLDTFTGRDLIQRTVAKSSATLHVTLQDETSATNTTTQTELAEIHPTFSLTPDQTSIVLDNAISIRANGTDYRSTIRVISSASAVTDPVLYWTGNDGEKLKDESARLLAESLSIARQDANPLPNDTAPAYKTVRYRLGTSEQVERAQVLENNCGRLLIRTLRGALVSAPTDSTTTGCSPSPLYAQLTN